MGRGALPPRQHRCDGRHLPGVSTSVTRELAAGAMAGVTWEAGWTLPDPRLHPRCGAWPRGPPCTPACLAARPPWLLLHSPALRSSGFRVPAGIFPHLFYTKRALGVESRCPESLGGFTSESACSWER